MGFCSREANDLVFVKLSHESILDPTLPGWIFDMAPKVGIRPQSLCFQVSEEDAAQYQKPTKALADVLRGKGFRFAVEQFGIGRDPMRVLASTPMDFVKFDGSLMQTVAADSKTQEKLRAFVSNATRQNIQTIAARVENANTMAVLFQLGVGYMQGHYLQETEVVLEAAG
jgi:EAL domain-containing protein (putative c-di-GMP-specific phosphodiesterase class I)